MALVMLNEGLRMQIRNRIHETFNKRRNALDPKINLTQIQKELYSHIVSNEELNLIYKLNGYQNWILPRSHLDIWIPFTTDDGEHEARFSIVLDSGMPIPPHMHGCSYRNPKLIKSLPIYPEVADILREAHSINKERQKTVDLVSDLMDRCRTLKQLIELWPAALNYVDDETRKKHFAEKRKKSAKEKVELDEATKLALVKLNLS